VKSPFNALLPSANINYALTEKVKIKAAYSKTLNRPEFRELAPFPYYDFNFDVTRIGNLNLKSATIQNIDLGIQLSPAREDLISITAFYKKFNNPIEARILNAGSGIAFGIGNAKEANSQGLEVEIRKSLDFINMPNFKFLFNSSIIKSNVITGFSSIVGENRFLQGQSPYLVNAGLYFEKNAWQANLMYNVIGSRVFLVGDGVVSPSVYEMPRNVIDLNLSKSINDKLEIKLGVQDILNQAFRFYNDTDNNRKINTQTDDIFRTYKRGATTNLSVNFKF
jgi:outer membrane receptor protein involved in Fe transport